MGHILFALFEQDDCIIKQIGQRVELSPSTLTGMLRRMEQAGIVETRRDESDGRAVRVRLTRLGRSLRARCRFVEQTVTRVLCADMRPEDVDAVKRGLQKMVASMRADEQDAKRRARTRKRQRVAGGGP
jgi:DNA-binding MarR family transcriptional regulator